MSAKIRVGRKLESDAIIADAHCTRTCLYLSVILLLASVLYQILKIGYIDSAGAKGSRITRSGKARKPWKRRKARNAVKKINCN